MNQTFEREESMMQDLEDAIEVKSMVSEKKSLLEELLHMQKRIDELAPACAEKELKIVAKDNEKLDLSKKLRLANSDISHLQTSMMHLRDEVSSKDNELKSMNDDILYLKSQLLIVESESRELKAKDLENQERIHAYIQQTREYELTQINDKKLIDKVIEENSSLIKENAKVSTKLSRLESVDYTYKQRELKEAQNNSDLVLELKAALQQEKSSSHGMLNKIEIMRQRCEDLEKSILDRDKSEDENIMERSRVEKELNALHALSKSLSSENKILREEKLINEEIIDELKGKNTAIHAPRSNSREDEDDILIPADNKDQQFVAAVLVFCATRPDALRNHLSQILAQRPSHFQYHIIVSQDGNKTAVTQVAQKFVKDYKNVSHIQHEKTEIKKRNNYPAISAHYKWALDKAFKGFRYDHVIVTEDDLDIGNDFFSYFRWGKQVLNSDDTIWCVSAWNDNGGGPLIDSTRGDLIWRTDFFPGLGWMLTKKLWNELSPGFPVAYWDDWMRKPEVRKSRSCIRPEISRTSHNMKLAGKGSSGGMFKDYLSKISASSANIDFSLLPVTLVQKSIYDKRLIEQIENARPIDLQNTTGMEKTYNYKIVYKNIRDWHRLAAHFKLMTDIRVQLSCDDTGDCKRSFERTFVGPVQLYACMSDQSTRQTCCCNYDFCNGSSNNNSIYLIIMLAVIIIYSFQCSLQFPTFGILSV
nr:alpha-1,3-mannosyl-glycoprotein 2-beta-N-acetylglucosaminyltransferase (EC 2.4.1.101) I F48E3.1 [similarity] - Caenorhabditis elegans [Caenorhabditis elegans]